MEFWETVVKRTRETTVLDDPNFKETNAFLKLRQMQAIGGVFSLTFGVLALCYVILHSRFVKRSATQEYLFRLLLLHITCNILCNFHMMLLGHINISPSAWALCSVLGSIAGPAYIASHAFSNLIFLQRSKIVTKNMLMSKGLKVTLYLATIGTYAILVVLCIIFFFLRGELLPNNVCTHTYPWWGAIIVLIADLSLGAAFLVVFVAPVRAQAKFLSEHKATKESSEKLMRIAYKNLRWGGFSLCTTFCFIMIVIVARMVLELQDERSYAVYMLDWSFAPFETSANLLAALKLTSPVWKQPYISVLKYRSNIINPVLGPNGTYHGSYSKSRISLRYAQSAALPSAPVTSTFNSSRKTQSTAD